MQQIIQGDCLEVLATMAENSVDAIVTDPPAGIGFMGKDWDKNKGGRDHWIAWMQLVATECRRVLKPGGHALVWALPRTSHWTATAWENAGFEPRDRIAHCFGSGFPKSADISKAIDKMDAAEAQQARRYRFTEWVRSQSVTSKQIDDATSTNMGGHYTTAASQPAIMTREHLEACRHLFRDVPAWVEREADIRSVESKNFAAREVVGQSTNQVGVGWVESGEAGYKPEFNITAPATEAARQWQGWGTALKPAIEDWWLFRKPFKGNVAANVLEHGTGALNIDACRVDCSDGKPVFNNGIERARNRSSYDTGGSNRTGEISHEGRWPANLIHDGSDCVVGLFPASIARPVKAENIGKSGDGTKRGLFGNGSVVQSGYYDTETSAARFFYAAKASKRDRDEGLDGTCTVKYNIDKSTIGGLSCKDVSTALVESLQKVTSESTLRWVTGECGASITGQCPTDSLSTTLTEISKITPSKILSLLTPSLISGCTVDANYVTESGGSLAVNVGSSSKSQPIFTSGSQAESARGVSLVVSQMLLRISDGANWKPTNNIHTTVKPTALMRYLCRLVTPPGGTVLDPFMGSGSTGKACVLEGFGFIGIEQDADYVEIARARIKATGMPLFSMDGG